MEPRVDPTSEQKGEKNVFLTSVCEGFTCLLPSSEGLAAIKSAYFPNETNYLRFPDMRNCEGFPLDSAAALDYATFPSCHRSAVTQRFIP